MTPAERDERSLLARLRADASILAAAFGLELASLRRTRKDARLYGVCDSEGHIRIRLRSRTTGRFLTYSSLVATLCHELAHLRHFDHGREFQALYRQLVRFARSRGIYQPRSAGARASARGAATGSLFADRAASAPARGRRPAPARPGPRQLPLFDQE